MAATYRIIAKEILIGNTLSMISLFNDVGSAQVLKVNRIWIMNNQVAPVTGAMVQLILAMINFHNIGAGSLKLTPVKMDLSSGALDANVYAGSRASVTEFAVLRRIFWSSDEPAQNEYNQDTWGIIPCMNLIWDSGYNSTSIEPLTLNAGEGVHLYCGTSGTMYLGTIIMEFTT